MKGVLAKGFDMSGDVAEATATDFLKFANALIAVCQREFRALALDAVVAEGGAQAAEAAVARLGHVHAELVDAIDRFCPDGENVEIWTTRYSDRRPVISAMPMDGGYCYVHAWHPDPSVNNRRDLDVVTTAGGTRKQMIVTAPGVIDAVSLPEIAAAGDGQPVPARTASKED